MKARERYKMGEEAWVRDQSRGITAAKRLLRFDADADGRRLPAIAGAVAAAGYTAPDDVLFMSRAAAESAYRQLHPPPRFRGLMSHQTMVKFLGACMAQRAKKQVRGGAGGVNRAAQARVSAANAERERGEQQAVVKHKRAASILLAAAPLAAAAASASINTTTPIDMSTSRSPSPPAAPRSSR